MEWHRIMDAALDTVAEERVTQGVTPVTFDDVEVVTGFSIIGIAWKQDAAVPEQLAVSPGEFAAARVPVVQPRKFGAKHGGLQRIEPGVVAALLMCVVRDAAVVAQHSDASGEVGIVRGHGASLAPRAEIFARIKAEASRRANRACVNLTAVDRGARAMSLAGILDELEVVLIRDFEQILHLRRQSVQMHRHNRLGAVGRRETAALEIAAQRGDAHVARYGIDIHKSRSCARLHNGFSGADESHRRRDHLVASADSNREQGEAQRVSTAAHADNVPDTEVVGKFSFEGGDVRSAYVSSIAMNFIKGAFNVGANFFVLRR